MTYYCSRYRGPISHSSLSCVQIFFLSCYVIHQVFVNVACCKKCIPQRFILFILFFRKLFYLLFLLLGYSCPAPQFYLFILLFLLIMMSLFMSCTLYFIIFLLSLLLGFSYPRPISILVQALTSSRKPQCTYTQVSKINLNLNFAHLCRLDQPRLCLDDKEQKFHG